MVTRAALTWCCQCPSPSPSSRRRAGGHEAEKEASAPLANLRSFIHGSSRLSVWAACRQPWALWGAQNAAWPHRAVAVVVPSGTHAGAKFGAAEPGGWPGKLPVRHGSERVQQVVCVLG